VVEGGATDALGLRLGLNTWVKGGVILNVEYRWQDLG
jgi:hypothetical protein